MALGKPTVKETAAEETVTEAPEVKEEQVQEPEQRVTEAPEKETSSEVAETQETKQEQQLAVREHINMIEKTINEMAEEGLEGLSVGFMSFDSIRLKDGQFIMGSDEEELGREFSCVVVTTRPRYIVRQSSDGDADVYYSYQKDGLVDTEGNDKTELLREWKEDGYENPIIKEYAEVLALLSRPEDQDKNGAMVMLSVPPTSLQRFSGFLVQQRMMRRKKHSDFLLTCTIGKKVGSGNTAFYPWAFKDGGEVPTSILPE